MNKKGVKTLLNKDPDFFKNMRAKRTTPGKFALDNDLAKRAANARWHKSETVKPKEEVQEPDTSTKA